MSAVINVVCTVREVGTVLSTVRGAELSIAGGSSSLSVAMKAQSGLLVVRNFRLLLLKSKVKMACC